MVGQCDRNAVLNPFYSWASSTIIVVRELQPSISVPNDTFHAPGQGGLCSGQFTQTVEMISPTAGITVTVPSGDAPWIVAFSSAVVLDTQVTMKIQWDWTISLTESKQMLKEPSFTVSTFWSSFNVVLNFYEVASESF